MSRNRRASSYDRLMDSWSDVFSIQLENARWLIEQERGRIDGFHQRASYFLGFTGVILAILPSVINPVITTRGWFARDICWGLLIAAVLLLALGALYSVKAMGIRSVFEVPVKGMQTRWVEWSSDLPESPDSAQVLADYANALFGRGETAKESALLALRAEGDYRATRLRNAVALTLAGISALGLLPIVLMTVRI